MSKIIRLFPLILIFNLAACVWPVPPHDTFSPSPTPTCPVNKMSFKQDSGCLNDGSVEFCLPAADRAALIAVQQIAPDVQCIKAGGRAHCDLNTEILCLVETSSVCKTYTSALPDSRWQTLCELAALPVVRQIVPTWYE